jgi:hypothetical protein
VHLHLVQADSEFPNDNPLLSDPCGVLELIRRSLLPPPVPEAEPEAEARLAAPPAVASDEGDEEEAGEGNANEDDAAEDDGDEDDGDDIEIVDEFDPIEFEIAEPPASDTRLADDPFSTFVRTLVEVAQDAGCTRAAALLPALLDGGQVETGVLGEPMIDGLVTAGVLARGPSGLVGGETFRRTADAWRAILRGDSDDFGACGPRMLDEWAADLVARIVAAPAKTEQLRRELRTRGIAAFGMVMAA